MKKITDKLEEISHLAKTSSGPEKTVEAIKALRALVKDPKEASGAKELLGKLDGELEIWQSKIAVIFKEPVGREGMSRHAKHWVEELRKING
jgi:hypothetical protein